MSADAGVSPNLSAAGWRILPDTGFIDHVGPLWHRSGTTVAHYAFVATAVHVNLLGAVHGGMLMTFADRAMGLESWRAADMHPSATIQFSMQFVSAARIGEIVECAPVLVRRTGSLAFMTATVEVAGRAVATCHGAWKYLAQERT